MLRLGSGQRCESKATRPLAVTRSCNAAQSFLVLFAEVKNGIAGLLLVLTFGPAYTSVLLHPVYGQRWGKIAALGALAVHCPYLLLLPVKGRQITMMQQDPSQASLLRFDMCQQGCWQ